LGYLKICENIHAMLCGSWFS